MDIPVTEKIS